MVKGFRQIASLTMISRIFGMIRDITFSRFLGAGEMMDIWAIAFKIPNLARRLFGEGAASASFIPVYSQQLSKDRDQAAKLANTMVTVIFIILSAIVLIGWTGMWIYNLIAKPNEETTLILSLSSVMLPYMIMICTVAILSGILNVHKHFAMPALAPLILNIFIITAALLAGWALNIPEKTQVFCIAFAVLIAGLMQIAMQIPPLRKCGLHIKPAWDIHSDAFKKIILMMAPMIIGLTVTQINTLLDDLVAWWFSGSDEKGQFFMLLGRQIQYPLWRGSVSHLYYAQRLYQLPLGVFGISLATAFFPVMSENAARGQMSQLAKTISNSIKGAIFVAIPATVGVIILARPLVAAMFQKDKFDAHDTAITAWTLVFYSIGLCGFFIQQLLTRAFYSTQDSKTPMRSAIAAVFVNIILNLTLIWFMGAAGLALSTAICSYLQVFFLIFLLRKKFAGLLDGIWQAIAKIAVSTAAMWIASAGILKLLDPLPLSRWFDILRLAAVVPIAAGVYFIIAKKLHIEALSLITGTKRHAKNPAQTNKY